MSLVYYFSLTSLKQSFNRVFQYLFVCVWGGGGGGEGVSRALISDFFRCSQFDLLFICHFFFFFLTVILCQILNDLFIYDS